jgi:hypothetical protein
MFIVKFWIDNDVHPSVSNVSTDFSRVHLLEDGLALDKLGLCLSSQNAFFSFVLSHPLSLFIADGDAKIYGIFV